MNRLKKAFTGIGPVLRRAVLLMFFLTAGQAAAQSGFTDVDPDAWSARYIAAIRDAGITLGCGDGKYCPEASVTREQMAAFLIRAVAGEPPPDYCAGQAPFADVSPAGWACGYIKWLGELGVTAGCGGANYCPEAVVTREQMAAFVVRALEGEPAADACAASTPFSDVAPESWSCGYIRRLAELGITSGCGDGRYCPAAPVRRDEMAAFLARAFLGVGDGSVWKGPVNLVELSAADTTRLSASWLPLNDPAIAESSITYQLHLSALADFLPGVGTLAAEGLGQHSAILDGLVPGTRYHARVRAIGPQGQQTTSDELSVQLPSLSAVRTATPLHEWQSGDAVRLGPDSFRLGPGVAIPAIGELIVNRSDDGYLKRVTNVIGSAGQTIIETTPAGLHDVFEQLQLSSAIDIAPVPEAAAVTAANALGAAPSAAVPATAATYRPTAQGNRVTWSSTGFSLSSAGAVQTQSSARSPLPGAHTAAVAAGPAVVADVAQPLFSETTARTTERGKWASVVGPEAVALVPENGGAVQIKLKVDRDDKKILGGERIPIALCKVADLEIKAPKGKDGSGLASLGSFEVTGSETVPTYGGGSYEAARAATQWLHIQARAEQVSADPYRVSFTAYIDEAGNACAESPRWFLGWKDRIDFDLEVYVASEPNFPTQEVAKLRFSGGFTVDNRVEFSFAPELEAEVEIKNFLVDQARVVSRTSALFDQQLTITATGAASLDATRTLIGERKFIKVFLLGQVPVVMTGSLGADLRIHGQTTGAIVADEQIRMGFENLEYGFEYRDGSWNEIKHVEPVYQLRLSGDANAEANLTLSLLPRLKVTFYEALTGRLLVEPYVTAEAGIHGHVYADVVPEGLTADADYWLTKGTLGGGLNAWIFANVEGCKLNLCKWPQAADEADYTTYTKLELIGNTPILGLPGLGVAEDRGRAHPRDSRAILFQGEHNDVPNPFRALFGVGPDAFIPFRQWTAPKVVALNDLGYQALGADAQDPPGAHWIAFDRPGDYLVRLGGYSSLGGWARQVAETGVRLTDDDRDGMLDWWEAAYGIDDPNEDANGNGRSNLDEFRAGACPTCPPISLSASVLGRGRVLGAGIDCPGTCTAHFNESVSLLLTAEPDLGSAFEGWGDACAARGSAPTCELVVDGSTRVSARFSGAGDGEFPWMPLNDTGIVGCADASRNNLPCPVSGYPGQDAQDGRDATHNDDGDGHAGFSFTKLDANGNALSASATSWRCVRDNVTGLVWEVKTNDSGLRDKDWTYSWYNPDASTNGGFAGSPDYGNNCYDTARCDTHKYAADVNSQGLCGARDWRLPDRFELESITSNDRSNPAIDTAFFPNTQSSWFWSSSPYAYPLHSAWSVDFSNGSVRYGYKLNQDYVRLVRGGQ